jgi:hypothetical protein
MRTENEIRKKFLKIMADVHRLINEDKENEKELSVLAGQTAILLWILGDDEEVKAVQKMVNDNLNNLVSP